jgi:hypothetical protein
MISTKAVDNFVDKSLLTGQRASHYAAFNKMLKSKAKNNPFKINALQIKKSGPIKNIIIFLLAFFVHKCDSLLALACHTAISR